MRRLLLLLLATALSAAPLAAQRVPAPVVSRHALVPPASAVPGLPAVPRDWRESPVVVVAASALVPGAWQWLQGQRRWVPYLALELWSWLRFREHRAAADEAAARYRDVAWRVARRVSVGARRDTTFEYYEAMAQDDASGAWDLLPQQEGLQPEQLLGTFNGDLWNLASRLYFGGGDYGPGTPQYQAALEYYRARAIPDTYAWAWGVNQLEKRVFQDLISESDEAYRDGTRMLAIILANHFASAIDALISSRLRDAAPGEARLRTGLVPDGAGTRLETRIRITF